MRLSFLHTSLALLLIITAEAEQAVFSENGHSDLGDTITRPGIQADGNDFGRVGNVDGKYRFEWPIKDVAIIGAGVSGLLSYRALSGQDFRKIRLFERDDAPGGNWHYSDEVPPSIPITRGDDDDWWKVDFEPYFQNDKLPPEYHNGEYPSEKRQERDDQYDSKQEDVTAKLPWRKVYDVSSGTNKSERQVLRSHLEKRRIGLRLPKPLWKSLKANTPAPQQQVPGFPWPPGVEWASHHSKVSRYLRSFASWLGISPGDDSTGSRTDTGPDVSFNTRVEHISKRFVGGRHHGWTLVLHSFIRVDQNRYEERYWEEHFDAVVIAAGRFNIPHIPSIPGLADWQVRFPSEILHSRQYRSPEISQGKNVIVVGASASATGISIDINSYAAISYLSIRHSDDPRAPVSRQTHLTTVPSNTTFIGEIKAFHPVHHGQTISEGKIELLNGSVITGVDQLIFGTGFRYAFPFLPQYHNTSGAAAGNHPIDSESGEQPIVTDGTHLRSLYLDTFYIDQPTIAFQGQNVGIQTFVYGKYAGEAIARVWDGKARLPNRASMWGHFWNEVELRGGLKKGYQWFNAKLNKRYLRFFITWLNDEAIKNGGDLLDPAPDVDEVMSLWMKARENGLLSDVNPNPDGRNDFDFVTSHSRGKDVIGIGEWQQAAQDDW
ncbi:hypothetical protein I317_03532 [Kwoniella heveanensis CBS 569]|nr:hypothetical protein I317_03532 [Kwoniella heveanensis CBS 569]